MKKLRLLTFAALVLIFASAVNVHAQKESVIYNFGSKSGDPFGPGAYFSGIIAQGGDGNLYSTTPGGGAYVDFGAVFKITPAGNLTVLYNFNGLVGDGPTGLTLGRDGNFYGTTLQSDPGYGTIFRWITSSGSLSVLYSFTDGSDGASPYAPPVQGTDGNFYGTTSGGGANGDGTVYRCVVTASGICTFTSLHQFDYTHGANPLAPLVQGTDGNFYGTAWHGTNANAGVVFKITTAGKFTLLHSFCLQSGCPDGANPVGPLVQGSDGDFYGTTINAGTFGYGTVFKITPTGSLTVLHSMNGATDGGNPYAGLVQATDGYFYGVTPRGGTDGDGTIFKISSAGSFSPLYSFNGSTGSNPYVTPFQHTNAIVFGDTQLGGTGNVSPCTTGNCGVFYSWSNATTLKPFVSLLPYSGKVGATIEFLGQGFTPSTTVSFNGTTASRTVVSGTYLTATVPNGATTGFVAVTTSSGTLKSNKIFRVIPQITSFSPTSGPPGTSVVINGESFTGATSVTFGGVKGTLTSVSYTKITATVPSGAKTGKITVTTPGGTATSSGTFTVT
jgi:uncharacterized repeat protein (TIGR03803 family)